MTTPANDVAFQVEALNVKAGDLVIVRCDAPTREAFEQLRSVLEPLSHALGVRIIALPSSAELEVVERDRLFQLGFRIYDRAGDFPALSPYSPANSIPDRERFARMVAETAAELGLVVMKPRA